MYKFTIISFSQMYHFIIISCKEVNSQLLNRSFVQNSAFSLLLWKFASFIHICKYVLVRIYTSGNTISCEYILVWPSVNTHYCVVHMYSQSQSKVCSLTLKPEPPCIFTLHIFFIHLDNLSMMPRVTLKHTIWFGHISSLHYQIVSLFFRICKCYPYFYLLAESIYEISITFIHTSLNVWRLHNVVKCTEFHTNMQSIGCVLAKPTIHAMK